MLTTLYNFCSLANCADSMYPSGAVIQGSDGNFYGTTRGGSCTASGSECGSVFQLTPSGVLTTLYDFCTLVGCPDGAFPIGGVVEGSDGNFYGTTGLGGSNCTVIGGPGGCGTAFQLTPGGVLTTLHDFCSVAGCADGRYPQDRMLQGSDGNFYGATPGLDAGIGGTVFQLTPSGAFRTLYAFCSQNFHGKCSDGSNPSAAPVMGTDGNLYGTTSLGGEQFGPVPAKCNGTKGKGIGCGTIYRLTLSGVLTTQYSFCPLYNGWPDCGRGSDGIMPYAELLRAANGSFYGSTLGSGGGGSGTVGSGAIFYFSPNVSLNPTFKPAALTFSKQTVGTTSKAKAEVIENVNTGLATLDFTGFTITGPFAISTSNCTTVAAGKTCRLFITFTPTATGPASGILTISNNAPNSPQTVNLSGTGK